MGWIPIEQRMPPEALHVLMEISGMTTDSHGCTCYYDHGFVIGCWIIPQGEKEVRWLLNTREEVYDPEIHAWMPLPKHYQPQKMFSQDPDLMEHSILRDDDPEMYQGEYVYEQMSLEEFLKGEVTHDWN